MACMYYHIPIIQTDLKSDEDWIETNVRSYTFPSAFVDYSQIVCTYNSFPELDYVSCMYHLSSSFFVQKKKKYKPVAQKVRPVITAVPPQFCINRKIDGDPLAKMPALNPNPPKFTLTGRYTQECKDGINKIHSDDFLWDSELNLLHHFMSIQNQGFAWTDLERGR